VSCFVPCAPRSCRSLELLVYAQDVTTSVFVTGELDPESSFVGPTDLEGWCVPLTTPHTLVLCAGRWLTFWCCWLFLLLCLPAVCRRSREECNRAFLEEIMCVGAAGDDE